MRYETDFLPADEHENFLQFDCKLWDWVGRHFQSTQNDKFTISLQYLKKNVKDKADFLPADKLQRFLRIDTTFLAVRGQACPNYPK